MEIETSEHFVICGLFEPKINKDRIKLVVCVPVSVLSGFAALWLCGPAQTT